ncbi:polyprenyl synthetase family protein [Candidatus Desantisbacteria bacterium]|nr:polyprenyl synthetase family protein [Candidatus Desantisbacteria bacterium]
MDISKYLKTNAKLIDNNLDKYLPPEDEYPDIIHKAMRYSVINGGKRIRPILCLAACETVGGKKEDALMVACAIELIHAYSLIHDDLPAMDNDDFRRGKPSCHKKYGEAIAILTGDALLTHAFYLISKGKNPEQNNKILEEISYAISTFGMIGGQVVDMLSENKLPEAPVLQYIHTHKTGALICASVKAGCILGGGGEKELDTLTKYGELIGLAFQIVDDIIEIEGEKGKMRNSDMEQSKLTYPAVYGIAESKQRASQLITKATSLLDEFGGSSTPLYQIAEFIGNRGY